MPEKKKKPKKPGLLERILGRRPESVKSAKSAILKAKARKKKELEKIAKDL